MENVFFKHKININQGISFKSDSIRRNVVTGDHQFGSIQIPKNLTISFDRSQKNQRMEVIIQNNKWKTVHLMSIDIKSPILRICETLNDEGTFMEPMNEMRLTFEADFVPNRFHSSTEIGFNFGFCVIRRTVLIQYQTKGPTIRKNEYNTPIELTKLISGEYRQSRCALYDEFDKLIPSFDENYKEHFHNLFYLEEISLRKALKDTYSKKEAYFCDQEYEKENVRRKYERGIYDLAVNDLFELRPSLQIGE